ncbi:MAG: arsenite methyltransferase [Candidatus Zixiibacteriota bacterium]
MADSDNIKKLVKEKYGQIASQSREQNVSSCCGTGGCCSDLTYTVIGEDYSKLEGYASEADLGLGCGIPTEYAGIKAGDTVLDLGSGAGNDVFVARRLVGEAGRVIGLDMTEEMIAKARANNEKLGYKNVEFVLGDIEKMPVPSGSVDVVISNCVLNLVPDKGAAFAEIFRVLKPGGHFSISDVVTRGELPLKIKAAAEMYVGCVAGAPDRNVYLDIIRGCGFDDARVVKERNIDIADEILKQYLNNEELQAFKRSSTAVLSVTVIGTKPGK